MNKEEKARVEADALRSAADDYVNYRGQLRVEWWLRSRADKLSPTGRKPEDGCAECTEAGKRNCIAGCRPTTDEIHPGEVFL